MKAFAPNFRRSFFQFLILAIAAEILAPVAMASEIDCEQILRQPSVQKLVLRGASVDGATRDSMEKLSAYSTGAALASWGVAFGGLLATPKRGPALLMAGIGAFGASLGVREFARYRRALPVPGAFPAGEVGCIDSAIRKARERNRNESGAQNSAQIASDLKKGGPVDAGLGDLDSAPDASAISAR